jgi:hypothetical protein
MRFTQASKNVGRMLHMQDSCERRLENSPVAVHANILRTKLFEDNRLVPPLEAWH